MNLDKYDLEELLLTAIKSEVESNKLYKKTAKKTENGLLQDKLEFLANEEDKHKIYVEDIYRNHYPGKEIKLPKITPVPLPEIKINDDMPVSKILISAMVAEKSAQDFYKSLNHLHHFLHHLPTLLIFGQSSLPHQNYENLYW